ncbi:Phosphomannomutase [Fasciola gigantica]|uniref:Phosphomannomutase n=1 Tax=Fasciola gigantica TaxID=46835 RepID=A0A504YHJ0_FASGI|nr:Phosphomannomutase [Fasciola gigantica]
MAAWWRTSYGKIRICVLREWSSRASVWQTDSKYGRYFVSAGSKKSIFKQSIVDHLGEDLIQKFINYALGYMSKLELPRKRGTFVEFRKGLINICPIGRSCTQAERDEFAEYDDCFLKSLCMCVELKLTHFRLV